MKLHEYINGVNKTWHKADGLKELAHCRLGAVKEIGSLAGWHNKRLSYGVPDSIVRPGLKEAYGKLVYYIVKTSELAGCEGIIENRFEEVSISGVDSLDVISAIGGITEASSILIQASFHSKEYHIQLTLMLDSLLAMIAYERWELDDILYESLAQADKDAGS